MCRDARRSCGGVSSVACVRRGGGGALRGCVLMVAVEVCGRLDRGGGGVRKVASWWWRRVEEVAELRVKCAEKLRRGDGGAW